MDLPSPVSLGSLIVVFVQEVETFFTKDSRGHPGCLRYADFRDDPDHPGNARHKERSDHEGRPSGWDLFRQAIKDNQKKEK
ncbi:MAG: hypothetical protein GY822_03150 [Deltaproteobacteria bacterium]|nr:hypothetical protein [Deltaproteobacteria bacterium]